MSDMKYVSGMGSERTELLAPISGYTMRISGYTMLLAKIICRGKNFKSSSCLCLSPWLDTALSTIDMHTERNVRMIRAELAREKKENKANTIMILRLKAQVANIETQQAISVADWEKKNVEFFGVRAESERYQELLRLVSEKREALQLEMHDMKEKEKEAKSIGHRFYRRKHGAMARMCEAFGWSSIRKEKGWAGVLLYIVVI